MKLKNPEVRIETCSRCNANCTICPREKMTRPKVVMPMGHFRNLVDQSKALGASTISIFGYGEPLMDRGIVEKVRYCSEHGLDTFITTNGSLLNCDLASRLIDAGLSHIRISAHGIWFSYERVHKNLRFDVLLRNVANLIKTNNIKYDHAAAIGVVVIPMEGETVDEIRAFWDRWDLDELEIWRPHNWASGRNYRDVKIRKKTCGRPFNGPVQINADGKMMICCFDTDATMTVGDTYTDSIETILKGAAFNKIRDAHRTGGLNGLVCENCDQLNEYHESPLLYSTVDPLCEVGKTSSMKIKLET